jgi:hypothetical protein
MQARWLKSNKSLSPQSPYKWKINIKKQTPMLSGPYMVINQLINSIWKVAHLENSLLCILRKKISIQ